MAIVHDPALTVARTPDIPPHARLDGCPECVVNAELPKSTAALADGFRAAYLCTDCGHAWTTDWKD